MLDADRFRGSMLGLACGDALGTTLEFMSPTSFAPITDMVGGGPFHLRAGQWTDDTSMALCLAESLVEQRSFDATDQMQRYVSWWRKGHLSSTGKCFDIGKTTRASLHCYEVTGEVYCGLTDPQSAGNGSLMRLAPAALFFAADPAQAIEMAAVSSRTTHAAVAAIDACRYMAGLIVGALHGASRDELLADSYAPVPGYWVEHPLTPEIAEVASGSFTRREPPEIKGSGYVVRSLEAALWAFHKGQSFRESCLLAALAELGEAWRENLELARAQFEARWREQVGRSVEQRFEALKPRLRAEMERQIAARLEEEAERARVASVRAVTERLNQIARRLDQAGDFKAWVAALLDAAQAFATRVVLFSVVGGEARYEGARAPDWQEDGGLRALKLKVLEVPAFADVLESKDAVISMADAASLSVRLAAALGCSDEQRVSLIPVLTGQGEQQRMVSAIPVRRKQQIPDRYQRARSGDGAGRGGAGCAPRSVEDGWPLPAGALMTIAPASLAPAPVETPSEWAHFLARGAGSARQGAALRPGEGGRDAPVPVAGGAPGQGKRLPVHGLARRDGPRGVHSSSTSSCTPPR